MTRQGKRFVLEVDRPGVKNQPHSVIDEPLAFKFPALGRNTVAIIDQDGRFIELNANGFAMILGIRLRTSERQKYSSQSNRARL